VVYKGRKDRSLRVKTSCRSSSNSPGGGSGEESIVGILPIMWLPLSKKMAAMVGCWWQPTTIV